MPRLRLLELDASNNVLTEITLRPDNPSYPSDAIACSRFDLGFPAIREAIQNISFASGVNDLTLYHGARTVSVDLKILGSQKEYILDELSRLSNPNKRPYLYISRSSWPTERRMLLRPNEFTFVSDKAAAARFEVSMAWTCPSGLMEAVDKSAVALSPPSATTSGLALPISYPVTPGGIGWAAGSGSNLVTAMSLGTAPALPTIRIYGRCDNPVINFRRQNKRMAFTGLAGVTGTGLAVQANHYLEIDVVSKTVLMDGDLNNSQLNTIDWSVSSWPDIVPGANEISFDASNTDDNCFALVEWRDQWI